MKASELRIGNLLLFPLNSNDKQFQEFESKIHSIVYDEDTDFCFINGTEIKDGIKPVTITEEWLLKFGFNAQYKGSKNFILNDDLGIEFDEYSDRINISVYCNSDEWGVGLMEMVEDPPCRFVHQLQNLYFALTGKELPEHVL